MLLLAPPAPLLPVGAAPAAAALGPPPPPSVTLLRRGCRGAAPAAPPRAGPAGAGLKAGCLLLGWPGAAGDGAGAGPAAALLAALGGMALRAAQEAPHAGCADGHVTSKGRRVIRDIDLCACGTCGTHNLPDTHNTHL